MTSPERSEPQPFCHSCSWPHIPTCLASPPGELSPSLRLHSPLISPAWSPLLGIRFVPQSPTPPLAMRPLHLEFSFPLLSVLSHISWELSQAQTASCCLPYSSLLSLSEPHLHPCHKDHKDFMVPVSWSEALIRRLPDASALPLCPHDAEGSGPRVLALLC